MTSELKQQADNLKRITEELEGAIMHSKIAADHFSTGEVPSACAHTLALEGHITTINEILNEIAKLHRIKAKV